nr:MAG TPA: hypothetical protein [Caudoviricetes sp.]
MKLRIWKCLAPVNRVMKWSIPTYLLSVKVSRKRRYKRLIPTGLLVNVI